MPTIALKAHITDDTGLAARIWHMAGAATYKKFPALAAYIDRIGAKQFNLRRFGIVEMVDGYPRQIASIKLTGDGELKVSGEKGKDYVPTKEEREAIAAERPGAALPKSIRGNRAMVDDLRRKLGRDAALYICIDRQAKASEGDVVMVEQRVEKDDGSKFFVPWTFFNDGKWRASEPDGGLSFWKPPEPREGAPIMVHEGAKKAKAVTDLISKPKELAAHPFGDVLARYEHWGMLGGAYRVPDVDWSELRNADPNEVVYVCDNDYPGKSALPQVSRHYGKALKGVMFDTDFPVGFDLAENMPKALLAESTGKYIGPTWHDLLKFATWATKTVPNPAGEGRPVTVMRPEFAQEWVHSVTPEVYIHRDWPFGILIEKEFNNKVRPFSDVDDTARLLKKDNASKTAVLAYRPAKPPGIFADDGKTYFNTHIAPPISPVDGDYSPFIEFMEHLIPDKDDRLETLRWCATLIVRGDIKMLYALLLISEVQGIGKGTLGEKILTPLVGINNCSIPSESEIVDSNFNYWCAHKRLAVVHEIYAGHSAKAYNKLKSIVTDKYISVSKKFQANYEIENWIHIVACSNSKRALQLSMDDRRWLVPRLTGEKWPVAAQGGRFSKAADYWAWFNSWLVEDEGLGKIKFWAREFLEKNAPVMTGAAAPWTEAKSEVVKEGYSQGMEIVAAFLEGLKEAEKVNAKATQKKPGRPIIVTSDVCREIIKLRLYDGRHNERLESPATIRKVAKAAGWFVSEMRVTIVQGLPKAYLFASDPEWLRVTPGKLRENKGADVWFLETTLPE